MRAQIDVLREVFEEWLRVHKMDRDYWIYTQEEWRGRREEYLTDAELIIAFENQLVDILNFSGPWEVEEELQDLAKGFGYYFELGNHWNIGFYPLDEWPALPPENARYSALLCDPRWKAKRNRINRRAGGKCENCGVAGKGLEVHHCYYKPPRYPWQYPDAALLALCRDCHKSRARVELDLRTFAPRLKTQELQDLQVMLDRCLYWFDRRRMFAFLASLGDHDAPVVERLKWLLETRGHPFERDKNADPGPGT